MRVLPVPRQRRGRILRNTDPDGWAQAIAIDEALRLDGSACHRGFRQPLNLHRSCRPLIGIDFDALAPEPLDPMVGECHGMCGV
ncbi:hypothetical protein [Fimbriiglobus ruber]|uniref:hypothetical protein n=1 Tax=Fimbriiglobus ruber TaxID=1908690 RepID=UPI000B4A7ED5|nr:hypothetical protein [Fimbriiglobus ruber]